MSNAEARPLPGEPTSLWLATTPRTSYPAMTGPVNVDVAVLGAGISGVTAAVRLREAGKTVALVDARRVVTGATGNTTAKVTALHNLIYRDLVRVHGGETASAYAAANQWAIETIASWAKERKIDCDLVRATAYTYADDPAQVAWIQEEAETAKRAGLPVRLTTDTGLPYRVEAAIALDDQAHFHPRKFLLALAASVPGEGSHVFEETTALDVRDGEPCVVETDRGEIRARQVIVTTHQPFLKHGSYYARMHLKRSYALAARIRCDVPRGMYISAGADFHSMRPQRDGRDTLLIVGGGPHRTGQVPDTEVLVRELEAWVRRHFDVEAVLYRWATQDNVTGDHLPYVGKLMSGSNRLLVATGFGGWGMTNGTVAGHLLADLVLDRRNPWADLYDPARTGLGERAAGLVKDAVRTTKDLTGSFERLPPPGTAHRNEGHIVDWGFEKVASYRDDAGVLHEVSAACPHMQCLVRWNHAERSWDCPCHGSRFDPDGCVLHGPATRGLSKVVRNTRSV